jgi:hypothetical protein
MRATRYAVPLVAVGVIALVLAHALHLPTAVWGALVAAASVTLAAGLWLAARSGLAADDVDFTR